MSINKVSEKKELNLLKTLQSIVGAENVSDSSAVRAAYRGTNFNFLVPLGESPKFVVMPRTVEHVQEVVKLANEERLTILPIGCGTVTPFMAADILLDMMGMNKILKIDTENCFVLVEPGATFASLEPLLRKEGYTIAVGSYPTGFSILTNLSIRRSFNTNFSTRMADQTLGMEFVLPDGTLLRTGSATYGRDYWSSLQMGTPDLRGLFTPGSQRVPSFGIMTKAAIKIWPMMEERGFPIVGFDTFESSMRYSQKVAKAGFADQTMSWNWVAMGQSEYAMKNPEKDKNFFNYLLDRTNEYNKPPKGLRYNYNWTLFRGYKEQVKVSLELCKRFAKECGGTYLEEDELQETIPNMVRYWRRAYVDLTPDDVWGDWVESVLVPGPMDVWYYMGHIGDLIRLEAGFMPHIKEKYNFRPMGYYTRVFEGGVGGHLRYWGITDFQDEYQMNKHMAMRTEINDWIRQTYPNIDANDYKPASKTMEGSIGMGEVLDRVRAALDPNSIFYQPALPGQARLEPVE